jgi:starch synthase
MIAPLYKERYGYYDFYRNIKITFTIHNIAYQGKADPRLINDLYGLGDHLYYNGNLRHDNCFNMMKSAILYSDMVTTVSPTYAKEILTDEYGEGLQSILNMKRDYLVGIINGIDYDVNNPEKDPNILHHFNVENWKTEKVKNKLALQREVGLPENEDVPLIGIVTRLTWQKGLDLILPKMEELVGRECQVVILGAGDRKYEEALAYWGENYPEKVSCNLKYDFGLSCRIYAGCDMFLMPSLFEPCGLSQMMSLRYGTIPVVRETGGLKDSVAAYNEYEKTGTGFSFAHYSADEMMSVIDYAIKIYNDKEHWDTIVENAMNEKLDWENSANKYMEVFNKLVD